MDQSELLDLLSADVVAAAPALLGSILCRGAMRARIVEVEAYRSDDPACHAFQRRTPRTEILYGRPGVAYVYFNYGVHWMLNIVAHAPEDPAAILIRAAQPLEGLDEMCANRHVSADRQLLSGPGKLAQAFLITGADNGLDLLDAEASALYFLAPKVRVTNVVTRPRVGIAEGKWHEVLWRFMDGDALEWVSRKP